MPIDEYMPSFDVAEVGLAPGDGEPGSPARLAPSPAVSSPG